MIPPSVTIKAGLLPDNPGVYFYYGADGTLLYVGKATSLKKRVGSYFQERQVGQEGRVRQDRIAELVGKIARIDYIETPTVIEALVLEANQIKAHMPPYNVLAKDDKSFQYLTISNEEYPRPVVMRGLDLEREGINPFKEFPSPFARGRSGGGGARKYLAVFGPYTSSLSLKRSLALVRPSIPWSTCAPRGLKPKASRPCFDYQLGKCPGVCVGAISKAEYRKTIRNLILFFEGKKTTIIRNLKRSMAVAAATLDFERAAELRRQIFAIEHIRDVSLITREDFELPFAPVADDGYINLNGRIEAYDISNISGTSAVGSMVVFEEGKPAKALYRKFKIKTVKGANDFAMMEEVMRRRLKRALPPAKGGLKGGGTWELPVLMVIDGGEGQVAVVRRVLDEILPPTTYPLQPKIIGLAKGFDRKQDRLVYDRSDVELGRAVSRGKEVLQRARDEAHRFAVSYHRTLRLKRSIYG